MIRGDELEPADALKLLEALVDAYNRHDVDGILGLMTPDCSFVSYFGPDVCGERYEGYEKVRQRVISGLAEFPDARWDDARHFVSGNRGVSEWTFRGTRRGTSEPEERWGVDLFTFKNGKVHVKNTYQKWRQPSQLRHEIRVPFIHAPVGRYAHAVRYRDMLYVSGCGPFDESGKLVAPGDIVMQTTRTFENIDAILRAAGSGFAKVIKETIYLIHIDDRQATRAVRERFYGSVLPASTVVEISHLVDPEMRIEVDIVAAV